MWVFRTPDEKWEKNCIMAAKKGDGLSVMVWGCFWGKQKGTFVTFIVKSVNAKIYLRILETLVLPVINHINQTVPTASNATNSSSGARFQQDNAPVHKAKIIGQLFPDHKIPVDDHPPYSPDLNPIEHIWVHLKRKLHKIHPDIASTTRGLDRVRARLIEALPEVWDSPPESLFERLWQSMPERVAAVIAAKGWYTRY